MSAQISFENCLTFINWQWQGGTERLAAAEAVARNAVTIAREAGSGAHTIAEKLAARLQAQASPTARPWTVFDRNLIEQVLEDHHLPARLARHLSEDRTTQFEDIMNDLFDVHPPSWELVRQTAETILRLAHLGKVILIGRGANLVTARLPNVLHVRLVAPLEQRIAHMQELRKLDRREAAALVRREDRERARYLKRYFKADVGNPLLYHLVINTGLVGYDEAVELIVSALRGGPAQA
ncbi:MAG TPA: cytidylate kinase-like family protein [Verrucomicrobiae bacterium]